jgi:hypothetical protein
MIAYLDVVSVLCNTQAFTLPPLMINSSHILYLRDNTFAVKVEEELLGRVTTQEIILIVISICWIQVAN